ncbi:MAG: hypothetical protein R3Y54_12485 [Eubacteriales bacterium]
MGLIYASDESQNLISILDENLTLAETMIEKLKIGSDHIVEAVEGRSLTGEAYLMGKGMFTDLIIPMIQNIASSMEQLQVELQQFQGANEEIVDENYLDEDNLERQIEVKRQEKYQISSTIETIRTLNRSGSAMNEGGLLSILIEQLNRKMEELQYEMEELERKCVKLRRFHESTMGLFVDSISSFQIAMQGMLLLQHTTINVDGSYTLPFKMDKSWFTELKLPEEKEKFFYNWLKDMPRNMSEEEMLAWVLDNLYEQESVLLNMLEPMNSIYAYTYDIVDSYIRYSKGKIFLKGIAITQDTSGVLRWGRKFLYDETIGLANSTIKLDKPINFDGNFKWGKRFSATTGVDLAYCNYFKMVNKELTGWHLLNTGKKSFVDSFPINDFKGWKGISNWGKIAKSSGIISTGMTISSNWNINVDSSDGIQANEVLDFVIDTTLDTSASMSATAIGGMVGSLVLPPASIVVGAALGTAIDIAFNAEFIGDPPKSLVGCVKDALKQSVRWFIS